MTSTMSVPDAEISIDFMISSSTRVFTPVSKGR